MRIATWFVSGLLALFFLFAGSSKAFASWEVLTAASVGINEFAELSRGSKPDRHPVERS